MNVLHTRNERAEHAIDYLHLVKGTDNLIYPQSVEQSSILRTSEPTRWTQHQACFCRHTRQVLSGRCNWPKDPTKTEFLQPSTTVPGLKRGSIDGRNSKCLFCG